MTQESRNHIAEMIIVIGALVGAWFLLVAPMRERAREARIELERRRAAVEQLRAEATIPADVATALERRTERLFALAAPRPELEWHERILSFAYTSGLVVERITPARDMDAVRLGPIIVGTRRFQVQATGAFPDIAAFLSALATDAPMATVEHFSISRPSGEDAEVLTLAASVRIGELSAQWTGVAEVRP